jgi:uncharacterized membrane protein
MQAELLLLRLIHILGGIFWVGSGLFTAIFLLPVLAKAGPSAAHVATGLQKRRLMLVLPITALLTMASGARLMAITSNGFSRDYFTLASGKMYAVSAIAAIVAFLLSVIVSRPAAARMAELSHMAASGETDRQRLNAEIQRLQRRTAFSSTIAVVLLVLSAAGMAVARYL